MLCLIHMVNKNGVLMYILEINQCFCVAAFFNILSVCVCMYEDYPWCQYACVNKFFWLTIFAQAASESAYPLWFSTVEGSLTCTPCKRSSEFIVLVWEHLKFFNHPSIWVSVCVFFFLAPCIISIYFYFIALIPLPSINISFFIISLTKSSVWAMKLLWSACARADCLSLSYFTPHPFFLMTGYI